MFAPTAPCIIHLLKVHCHSVSLGKLCKINEWIAPLLLYSKVKVNIYILKILKSLLGFQVKIQGFQQFVDLCMLC